MNKTEKLNRIGSFINFAKKNTWQEFVVFCYLFCSNNNCNF